MSIVGDAELAVEAATGTRWVHVAVRLAPWVAIVALIVALAITRSTLDRVRLEARAQLAEARAADAKAVAADAQRLATAADGYATRTAALQPIILHSTDTVTRYAQTPAGRASCLDADRVRGIDDLDASVITSASAGGGAGAVHANAGAAPAGR